MRYIISILLSVIAINSFSQLGSKNFIDQNYIEVSGKAEKEISPDEIYLKIIVNEKDSKGKESLEELEKEMIKKMSNTGLDVNQDLVIVDMASNFKNYWLKSADIYSMKEYQLKCGDAATAGQVFRELESIGISNISIERIDHSELKKYQREVKVSAIKAAREKAEDLALAIDQEIGKAIHIQEQNFQPYRANSNVQMSNIMIRGTSSVEETVVQPEIEFEKIKIEYSIRVSFELK